MWQDLASFGGMGLFYVSTVPMVYKALVEKSHLHPATIVISILAEFMFLVVFISLDMPITIFITAMAFFMWVIIGILYVGRRAPCESLHN